MAIAIYIVMLAALCCVVYFGWQTYRLKSNQIDIVARNMLVIQENEAAERELSDNQRALVAIKQEIKFQQDGLQTTVQTIEDLRKQAKEQAQIAYEEEKERLDAQLKEHQTSVSANIQQQLVALAKEQELERLKLQDLKDKQLAYIQAQQRQLEIAEQQNYYRLVISEDDKTDIALLRDIQKRFYKRDAIDKLVWETYYKAAYDLLMSHIFSSKDKVCGIYKITDLTTGLAYIGQSVDVRERFRQHIKTSLSCDGATNKLYQTMQKSGQDNFTFELLEEVPRAKLNERETYWIDFYKTKEYGLNSTRGGS